jgi:ferric-dicitrate binding protein FerR (iron transport regulator)
MDAIHRRMSDAVLPLSRLAGDDLAAVRAAPAAPRREPVWRLLLAAIFMAGAALASAAVMILGAPGGVDAGAAKGEAVRMSLNAR